MTSLFVHERIRTTDAKAKELRRVAEKMITLGKRGDLHARRQAASVLRGPQASRKLFGELADRYRGTSGGYTRVVKVGPRRGDGAMISMLELVTPGTTPTGKRKKGGKKSGAAAKSTEKPAAKKSKEPKDQTTKKKQ